MKGNLAADQRLPRAMAFTPASTRSALLHVALVGNPNTGKSTLFGVMVGVHQRVGNYPGVTVEKKSGRMWHAGRQFEIVDLPGLYSLAVRSRDEKVVVDVLLGRSPGLAPIDAVVCVADASSLDRGLYLLSQLLELKLPTVLAINMMDVARAQGINIDAAEIQRRVGVPVVTLEANRRVGLAELQDRLLKATEAPSEVPPTPLPLPIQEETRRLARLVGSALSGDHNHASSPALREFLAQRLLIDVGGHLEKEIDETQDHLSAVIGQARARLAAAGHSVPEAETNARYEWARRVQEDAVQRSPIRNVSTTDRIDRLLTHRIWGSAILLLVMLVIFHVVFAGARPLTQLADRAAEWSVGQIEHLMTPGPLRDLLADGIVRGAGSVLAFIPQIAILFFFIAILEDCGYMARAAFLMDRVMARVGLSGKSFLPMLSSFACAVPGIMGARVVENERDRLATILVAPLLTCSARLPIYTLLIAAFIPARTFFGGLVSLQGLTLLALYGLGILAAVAMARLLKRTLLRGETPVFLLELPRYQWPSLRTAAHRVFERICLFLRTAGTLILAVSVVTWAAMYYPRHGSPRGSCLGQIGRVVEPLVRPLGWDWRIGCAVIASFPAREVVVATMGVILASGDAPQGSGNGGKPAVEEHPNSTHLATMLRAARWENSDRPLFGIPVALSIMVFFALCAQCAATLAVIRRETNSWRWPGFTFAYMTVLAYVGALLTYQIGTRIGL